MGYRSEVAIAIYGPEDVMVPMIVAQRMLKNSPLVVDKAHIERRSYTQNGKPWLMLYAYFEWVKWYDNYPEAKAWKALLADISDNCEDTGLAYEFVRVGENANDVQTKFGGDVEFYLGVRSSIYSEIPKDNQAKSSEDQHDNSVIC